MTTSSNSTADLSRSTGSWTLEPEGTSVEFHTKAMWVLKVVGTAKAIEGSGRVTSDGSVSGNLVIDAASVDTKNKKRDKHLQSDDFFEVVKYPTVTFTVTKGQLTPAGTLELVGDLTIHGQNRPISLVGEVAVTGDSADLSTTVVIDRSEWGLTWAKMGAGLINQLVIRARFTKSS